MNFQVELKPLQKKDGISYKVLTLTDLTLHTAHKQPSDIGKVIKESVQSSQPGRIYFPFTPPAGSISRESLLDMLKSDPNIIRMVQEEESKGFKVVIEIPKNIPLLAGMDIPEFLRSKNGKRVLRGLAKGDKIS